MYEGSYTDGASAVRHRVRVTVTMNRLYIADETGRTLDEWSFSGLRLAEDIYRSDQPVRLSQRGLRGPGDSPARRFTQLAARRSAIEAYDLLTTGVHPAGQDALYASGFQQIGGNLQRNAA